MKTSGSFRSRWQLRKDEEEGMEERLGVYDAITILQGEGLERDQQEGGYTPREPRVVSLRLSDAWGV